MAAINKILLFFWTARIFHICGRHVIGLYLFYYYYYSLRVFHISVNWLPFIGVWMIASILKCPGLFSVFWSISNAVLWMISTRPLISKSSSPFINPKALITIGINVTLMFHSFFQFLGKVEIFILLFTFFKFYSVVSRDSKDHNFVNSLFFVDYYKVWSSSRD